MARSSYTSSERRGVLAIAVIALLLIGAGFGVSFCERHEVGNPDNVIFKDSQVITHPGMVDSTAVKTQRDNKQNKKKSKSNSRKGKSSNTDKNKKPVRQRNPLEEPV